LRLKARATSLKGIACSRGNWGQPGASRLGQAQPRVHRHSAATGLPGAPAGRAQQPTHLPHRCRGRLDVVVGAGGQGAAHDRCKLVELDLAAAVGIGLQHQRVQVPGPDLVAQHLEGSRQLARVQRACI
jgi:hypothetical protein